MTVFCASTHGRRSTAPSPGGGWQTVLRRRAPGEPMQEGDERRRQIAVVDGVTLIAY